MAVTVQSNIVGFVRNYKILIPAADFRSSNTVPINILTSLGVGKVICPVFGSFVIKKAAGAVAYDFPSGAMQFSYDSAGLNQIGTYGEMQTLNTAAEVIAGLFVTTSSDPAFNPSNKGLYLFNDAGNASVGDGVVTFEFSAIVNNFN